MLYRAKSDKDEGVKTCGLVGNEGVFGYKLVNTYFVDSSGFGSRGESALIFVDFLNKVKKDFYYGIKESGQFQVYIGEYKKLTSLEKQRIKEVNGIVSSKIIKRNLKTILTVYKNGDKVLRLVNTDIIKWQGDKIILNSGGWDTVTTRARFNEFLPNGIWVFRKKAKTFIQYNGKELEFFDGVELEKTGAVK